MTKVLLFFGRPRVVAVLFIVIGCLASTALVTATAAIVRVGGQADDLAQFGVDAVQANIDARYDDCQQIEALKTAGRAQVRSGERTEPLLYELVPSLDTPQVHQIIERDRARQLKAYEKGSCSAYAREAIPAGAHPGVYRVP
jgi:hypothetical protein